MVNHYEVHVNFQDIECQLQENILHYFLRYNFLRNLHLIQKYLQSTQISLQAIFVTLPSHMNY